MAEDGAVTSASTQALGEMSEAWHAPMCGVDAGGGCIIHSDLKEAWRAGWIERDFQASTELAQARAEIEVIRKRHGDCDCYSILQAERDAALAVAKAAQKYNAIVSETHGVNVPWEALEEFRDALAAFDKARQ